jgi:hypothetical protein
MLQRHCNMMSREGGQAIEAVREDSTECCMIFIGSQGDFLCYHVNNNAPYTT